ncbi:MAG: phosphoenolpyruvate carboxylase, partial [Anaerolineae bacterium]|nr:phosphoenolpyruvate carboxylase [Anaerolineae bacterium]
QLSGHVTRLSKRYPTETYRTAAAHLAAELDLAHEDAVTDRLLGLETAEPPPQLRHAADVLAPLELMRANLEADDLGSVAQISINDFCHQVEVFGMHTARLDIRQYSTYHHEVLDELLVRLGYAAGYAARPASERTALLTDLFEKPLPDLSQLTDLSEQAAETVSLFAMLRRLVETYGTDSLGPYLVSMTQDVDDILVVLLFATWSGLCLNPDRPGEALAVAPLFETRTDLHDAPAIMSRLFTHPVYARHLAALGHRQMIMIGYSDSNKDAGYIAAQWELFRAQETIAETCRQHNIDLTLFHGRGGTIARGGGPTNRAILAQPAGSVNGKIRITEQGEVIAERYGNPAIARRHLEQVVSAVLMTSAPAHEAHTTPLNKWRQVMDELAQTGYRAYRKLIYETPELIDYWQQATPIQEISQLQIGSRPSRRASGDALATLRAIPWVFSWMQSRHVLPGWYGLGTALADYAATSDRLDDLKEMYQKWPFFTNAIDNAQVSLGKADMGIARLYADLVEDEQVRELIFTEIETEFKRTVNSILEITGQKKILDNDKTLQQSIRLRNPYVDPLNFIQVSLLRQLRALPEAETAETEQILPAILLTINGIAAGLKNTG